MSFLLSKFVFITMIHGHATSRRDLLKGLGAAPVALTTRSPEVSPLGVAPIAPTTVAAARGYVETRADLIRHLFASNHRRDENKTLPRVGLSPGGIDPWASSPLNTPKINVIEEREQILHPDVLRDWVLSTPEGAALSREVDEYWRVEAQLDRHDGRPMPQLRQRRDDLRRQIRETLKQDPWSTMDWFHVFAERIVAAELAVQGQAHLGLDLGQTRELFTNVLSGTDFKLALATRQPVAATYTTAALTAIIDAIKNFAPHLGGQRAAMHLGGRDLLSYRIDEIARFRLAAADGRDRKTLSNAQTYEFFANDLEAHNWALLFSGGGNWPLNFDGFDRFAARLPAAYREHIRVLNQFVANLAENPPTPLGQNLTREMERRLRELEFELLTLPARLKALRMLATVHQRTRTAATWRCSPETQDLLEYGMPVVHSRDWLRWRPSAVGDIKSMNRDRSDLSTLVRAALPDLASVEYLNLAWLRNLLGADVVFTSQALEWLSELTADEATESIPALTHQPVAPIVTCGSVLGNSDSREAMITEAGDATPGLDQ